MSEISNGPDHNPGRYEIRLQGHLDSRWAAWFDGLSLANESDGTTIIHGPVADQPALHGRELRLRRVCDQENGEVAARRRLQSRDHEPCVRTSRRRASFTSTWTSFGGRELRPTASEATLKANPARPADS